MPPGGKLLRELGKAQWPIHLLMDRAYEGDETQQLALDLNFIPVVPPKTNRVNAWEYDRPCTSDATRSSDCSGD